MTVNATSGPPEMANHQRADLQVVARVADILRLFTPTHPQMRLADATEALDLGRSTTHRYLSSLENHGFLKRVDGVNFELGPLIDQLGALSSGRWRVMEAAEPVMQQLSSSTRQTAVLSVWGGTAPVITRVTEDSSQIVHVSVRLGSTLSVESAQGLVFLSEMSPSRLTELLRPGSSAETIARLNERLAEVRSAGIASVETVAQGVRALAVPVHGPSGDIRAALALVGTMQSVPSNLDSGIAQALISAGHDLTALISGTAQISLSQD